MISFCVSLRKSMRWRSRRPLHALVRLWNGTQRMHVHWSNCGRHRPRRCFRLIYFALHKIWINRNKRDCSGDRRHSNINVFWLRVRSKSGCLLSLLFLFFSAEKSAHTSVTLNCITRSAAVSYSITIASNWIQTHASTSMHSVPTRWPTVSAHWITTYEYATDFQVRHFGLNGNAKQKSQYFWRMRRMPTPPYQHWRHSCIIMRQVWCGQSHRWRRSGCVERKKCFREAFYGNCWNGWMAERNVSCTYPWLTFCQAIGTLGFTWTCILPQHSAYGLWRAWDDSLGWNVMGSGRVVDAAFAPVTNASRCPIAVYGDMVRGGAIVLPARGRVQLHHIDVRKWRMEKCQRQHRRRWWREDRSGRKIRQPMVSARSHAFCELT